MKKRSRGVKSDSGCIAFESGWKFNEQKEEWENVEAHANQFSFVRWLLSFKLIPFLLVVNLFGTPTGNPFYNEKWRQMHLWNEIEFRTKWETTTKMKHRDLNAEKLKSRKIIPHENNK